MTGKEGRTYANIMTCGTTGLAILDYFALKEKPGINTADVRYAIELVARGLAALSGVTEYKDIVGVIAEMDDKGMLSLLKSGVILVKIMPMDTTKIKELHEMTQKVYRSL